MQRITVLHVVLIVAFIQCAYVKWKSLLHFAQTISNHFIIADVPTDELHSMHTGSNGAEYVFVVVSVPLTC